MRIHPLMPGRVRKPRGAYGWVDLRAVTCGWLRSMGPQTALTYLFLCTVANLEGVSFWSRQRIAEMLALDLSAIEAAVVELKRAELIAVNGRVVQVLPLPAAAAQQPAHNAPQQSRPSASSAPSAASEPAKTSSPLEEAEIAAWEPEARRRIAQALGAQHVSPTAVVRALASDLALEARRALLPTPVTAAGGEPRG